MIRLPLASAYETRPHDRWNDGGSKPSLLSLRVNFASSIENKRESERIGENLRIPQNPIEDFQLYPLDCFR